MANRSFFVLLIVGVAPRLTTYPYVVATHAGHDQTSETLEDSVVKEIESLVQPSISGLPYNNMATGHLVIFEADADGLPVGNRLFKTSISWPYTQL